MRASGKRAVRVLAVLAGLVPCALALAQQVVLVSVTTFGQGATEAQAVRDAVIAAVAQVSGESVAHSMRVDTVTSVDATGSRTRDQVAESIATSTHGIVRESRVLKVEAVPNTALYKATVASRVASFQQSQELQRVKLAVVLEAPSRGNALAEALRSRLSDQLVSTRKFAILDRSNAAAADEEFARIRAGRTDVAERARLAAQAVPDLLLVIGGLELRRDEEAERLRGRARVQVLDYASGQVRYATTASASTAKRDGGEDAVADRLAQGLSRQMIEHAYPPRVVHVEGESITLSMGGSTFSAGQKLQLLARGRELTDPVTKESLGWAETRVAVAEIDMVSGRIATARVPADASANLQRLFGGGQVIVARAMAAVAPAARAPGSGRGAVNVKDGEDW